MSRTLTHDGQFITIERLKREQLNAEGDIATARGYHMASLVAQSVRNPPAIQESQI